MSGCAGRDHPCPFLLLFNLPTDDKCNVSFAVGTSQKVSREDREIGNANFLNFRNYGKSINPF